VRSLSVTELTTHLEQLRRSTCRPSSRWRSPPSAAQRSSRSSSHRGDAVVGNLWPRAHCPGPGDRKALDPPRAHPLARRCATEGRADPVQRAQAARSALARWPMTCRTSTVLSGASRSRPPSFPTARSGPAPSCMYALSEHDRPKLNRGAPEPDPGSPQKAGAREAGSTRQTTVLLAPLAWQRPREVAA